MRKLEEFFLQKAEILQNLLKFPPTKVFGYAVCIIPISSSSANLLIIALNVLRSCRVVLQFIIYTYIVHCACALHANSTSIMDDGSDVRFIDAHPECNGGHNTLQLISQELVMCVFSPFR